MKFHTFAKPQALCEIFMNIRILISFFFIALFVNSYSQKGFVNGKKILSTNYFDTAKENILVYEVPNAIMYFNQKDISNFIKDLKNSSLLSKHMTQFLEDALLKESKTIRLRDVLYYLEDNGKKDSLQKKICEDFILPGAILMLDGKFMLYSKGAKAFVTNNLIVKKNKIIGEDSYEFYLTEEKMFYYIVVALD